MVPEQVKDKKHVKVTLVWGGTGESKPANPSLDDTAGDVFADVYKRFQQQPSDQDTFEINDRDFPRERFGDTVAKLVAEFGDDLNFEVIPPTSGV
jgi:hypothetical protein